MPTNPMDVIYCQVLKNKRDEIEGAQRGGTEHPLFVRKICPGMRLFECVADLDVYTVEKSGRELITFIS